MADFLDMLTQLRTEQAQLKVRDQQLSEAIRQLERLTGQGDFMQGVDPENPLPFSATTYGEAAQQLITEHGPLPTRELAELLLRGGVRTKARNFVATLYSLLHKDGRFQLVDRKWELKGKRGTKAARG
jgi:hypothetical protein